MSERPMLHAAGVDATRCLYNLIDRTHDAQGDAEAGFHSFCRVRLIVEDQPLTQRGTEPPQLGRRRGRQNPSNSRIDAMWPETRSPAKLCKPN